jgi:hypothetical protein
MLDSNGAMTEIQNPLAYVAGVATVLVFASADKLAWARSRHERYKEFN